MQTAVSTWLSGVARWIRARNVVAFIGAMICAGLCAVLLHWLHHTEPSYQGRKASWWFENSLSYSTNADTASIEAFQSMGGRGVDYLIAQFKCSDTVVDRSKVYVWTQIVIWSDRTPDKPNTGSRRQAHAAYLLGKLGPQAEPAIPIMIEALQSPRADTRGEAIRVLSSMGPAARSAAPALVPLILDKASHRGALRALVKINPEQPELLPALNKLLLSRDSDQLYVAERLLKELGPQARPLLPRLVELAHDPDLRVRWVALQAIIAIDADNPGITSGMSDMLAHDPRSARLFLRLVSNMGLSPRDVVSALTQLMRSTDDELRLLAVTALPSGSEARAALPVVQSMVNDTNALVSAKALEMLARFSGTNTNQSVTR